MGRKKIKKNFSNNTINNDVKHNSNQDDTLKNFIKILVGVSAILGVIFLVLNTFMDEDTTDSEAVDYTNNLGYSKILAQDTFNKPEDDYVVFFINGEEGKDEVNSYFEALSTGSVTRKVYVVDMAEQINSSYLVDDSEEVDKYGDFATVEYNKTPASADDLEVYNFPTVIHVTSGSLTAFYEGDEFYEPLGVTNPNASQGYQ
ncbi:MAG: hypothetical protein ACK5K7_07350 [Bacilli bacterium]